MTKQAINISIPFDPEATARALAREINAHANQVAVQMAKNLFMSRHDRQSPYLRKDTDSGIMYDKLLNMLADQAFNEEWEQYARAYIAKHFQAALDQALDQAIEHRARRIAFEQTAKETK